MSILLSHILFLALGIVIIYLLRKEAFVGMVSMLISLISLVYTLYIISSQDILINQKIDIVDIIPGIPLSFNLDYLSLIFLVISNGLWLMVSIFSERYLELNKYQNKPQFYIFFTLSMLATNGIIYSSNLLTTFIFYEILTIATYPLVTFKGDKKSIINGKKYLYYLLGTSIIFFLPAIIFTYILTGTLDYKVGGIFTSYNDSAIYILVILYLFGIAKSAVMPFHKWLPSAMVAPTPVSALLHAVAVVKSGVFIMLKVFLFIFGIDVLTQSGANIIIILFASFTIISSSFIALL